MVHNLPRAALEIPGFGESPEYLSLGEKLRSVPGLVLGQLGFYLSRLQAETLQGKVLTGTARALELGFRFLEQLSASGDAELENLVVVEILEPRHEDADVYSAFLGRLGPASKALHERWIGKGGTDTTSYEG